VKILNSFNEKVDIKQLKNILSIASKAGLVCLGSGAAVVAVKKGCCSLLILSYALSEKTKRAMLKVAVDFNTTCRVLRISLAEFEAMVGKYVGIVAVIDQGLAQKMNEILS
jgi:ribosomal protein L30E